VAKFRAGVSAQLNALAQREPPREKTLLPSASYFPNATGAYVANWAGALSALDANYDWMYTDGWAGARPTTTTVRVRTRLDAGVTATISWSTVRGCAVW